MQGSQDLEVKCVSAAALPAPLSNEDLLKLMVPVQCGGRDGLEKVRIFSGFWRMYGACNLSSDDGPSGRLINEYRVFELATSLCEMK